MPTPRRATLRFAATPAKTTWANTTTPANVTTWANTVTPANLTPDFADAYHAAKEGVKAAFDYDSDEAEAAMSFLEGFSQLTRLQSTCLRCIRGSRALGVRSSTSSTSLRKPAEPEMPGTG